MVEVSVLSSGALADFLFIVLCALLLHIHVRNFECSVGIGSNPCNAVFLSDFDNLSVPTLVTDTLIIEILDLLHRFSFLWKL